MLPRLTLLTLLASLCFGVAANDARAEIMVGETAEWLTHDSEMILLGTPVEVAPGKAGLRAVVRVRFRIDEVIRGPLTKGDVVTITDASDEAPTARYAAAKKAGRSMLVFAGVGRNLWPHINGKYVLSRVGRFASAYAPDAPVEDLYTPDFKCLTTFANLVARTRAQAKKDQHAVLHGFKMGEHHVEVPFDSEAHTKLYGRSTCYLKVPVRIDSTKPRR